MRTVALPLLFFYFLSPFWRDSVESEDLPVPLLKFSYVVYTDRNGHPLFAMIYKLQWAIANKLCPVGKALKHGQRCYEGLLLQWLKAESVVGCGRERKWLTEVPSSLPQEVQRHLQLLVGKPEALQNPVMR